MLNILKKIARSAKSIGRKHKTDREVKTTHPNLIRLWPDGTWQITAQGQTPAQWDILARGMLFEAFNFEKRKEFHKEFGRAYRAAATDVDTDWVPSIKQFTKFWNDGNRDTKFMYYMIARLQTLGNIRP